MSDQTPNVNNAENGDQPPFGQPVPPQAPPAAPHGQPVPPQGAPGNPYGAAPGQPVQDPSAQYYQQAPHQAAGAQGSWQQPQANPNQLADNINLNYWLSVFFVWIPALIFYFTDKGKSPLADQYNRENLNFSLLRTGAAIAAFILAFIPFIGWLLSLALNVGGFILHLLVAIKAKENFQKGAAPGFMFNIPMVK